jgi:polyhydroxyalkanoate synthesis regulator phasin
MLIIFKSKAAAEIVMYKKHLQEIFTFLDKDLDRGVITAAEAKDVIIKIESYIQEHQKNTENSDPYDDEDMDEIEKHKQLQEVSLSARLYPLLEMLQDANKKQTDILWGV